MIDINVVGFFVFGLGKWLNFLILGNEMLIIDVLLLFCICLIIFGKWCNVCGLKIILINGVCW